MTKLIVAAIVAAAMTLTMLHAGQSLAQSGTDKKATTDPQTKAKADEKKAKAEEKKAKADEKKAKAEERKAKADAKKAKAEEKKAKAADKKKAASAARAAVTERRRQCGTEWKEAKAAGKLEKGTTWPKFWSACNTRLKAKAA